MKKKVLLLIFLLMIEPVLSESCGDLGICTANPMCLFISVLEFVLGMITCLNPLFWMILLIGIAMVILFGLKGFAKNF